MFRFGTLFVERERFKMDEFEDLELEIFEGEDVEDVREFGWDVLAPGCYRKRVMRGY